MLDPLARQVIEVHRATLALAAQTVLLGLEAHRAWLGLLVRPAQQAIRANEEFRASLDRQERTARLVRRGIPERQARLGLRVV